MSSRPSAGYFRLLYFASASSFTRKPFDDLSAPMPMRDLFARLEKLYPGMLNTVLSSCAVTLNLDYVDLEEDQASDHQDEILINEGDEVAIIPPVSSG